jgi:hypothetical protein
MIVRGIRLETGPILITITDDDDRSQCVASDVVDVVACRASDRPGSMRRVHAESLWVCEGNDFGSLFSVAAGLPPSG